MGDLSKIKLLPVSPIQSIGRLESRRKRLLQSIEAARTLTQIAWFCRDNFRLTKTLKDFAFTAFREHLFTGRVLCFAVHFFSFSSAPHSFTSFFLILYSFLSFPLCLFSIHLSLPSSFVLFFKRFLWRGNNCTVFSSLPTKKSSGWIGPDWNLLNSNVNSCLATPKTKPMGLYLSAGSLKCRRRWHQGRRRRRRVIELQTYSCQKHGRFAELLTYFSLSCFSYSAVYAFFFSIVGAWQHDVSSAFFVLLSLFSLLLSLKVF